MSDTELSGQMENETVAKENAVQPTVIHQTVNKGGFMNGGWLTTLMFLMAFFIVSFSLGSMVERNNKFNSLGTVAGTQAAGGGTGSNFNVAGFKKVAADLKLDTGKFNSCLDSGKMASAVKKDTDEGFKVGVNGTPSFVINGVGLVGAQPYSVFKEALNGSPIAAAPDATASASLVDGKKVTSSISMDDVRVKGDKNAPITIVEYSDFQCPFCERFYSESYKQINEEYIKTGKAKIVFKDFPLTIHPQAPKAAEAARCAGEQGKFWEMHDKLFELQVS